MAENRVWIDFGRAWVKPQRFELKSLLQSIYHFTALTVRDMILGRRRMLMLLISTEAIKFYAGGKVYQLTQMESLH